MSSVWDHIRVFFKDSEVIVFARLQMLIGAITAALAFTDPDMIRQAIVSIGLEKWWPLLVVLGGIIMEYARRAREPHDLGIKTVADLSTVAMPIKKEDAVTVDQTTGAVTITPPVPTPPAGVVSKAAGE